MTAETAAALEAAMAAADTAMRAVDNGYIA